MFQGAKTIEPDKDHLTLFERIEKQYRDRTHGRFVFAGGIEIQLEKENSQIIWYFRYEGDDMCWWCPGGIKPIIEAWKNGLAFNDPYHEIQAFEGAGNYYWLIETNVTY